MININEEEQQRCIQAWRTHRAPKFDEQYDSLLPIFQKDGAWLPIQMRVVWNHTISDYQVGPVRQNAAGQWVPASLALQAEEYDKLTTMVLPAYGLTNFLRLEKQGQIQSIRRQGIPDCCRPKIVSDQR